MFIKSTDIIQEIIILNLNDEHNPVQLYFEIDMYFMCTVHRPR